MRTDTQSGITLEYPDALGFAFNPSLLIVRTGGKSMAVAITDGVDTINLAFSAYNGAVYGDVQAAVQQFFDVTSYELDYTQNGLQDTNLAKTLTFSVAVTDTATPPTIANFSFNVQYVWGAMTPDGKDVFNGLRKITWFTNFPFTFGVYSPAASGTLIVDNSDGASATISITDAGMLALNNDTFDANSRTIEIIDYGGTLVQGTFDTTFDYTFYLDQNLPQTTIAQITTDKTDEGFYLRWVNRHGFYCYWLFKAGAESRKVASIMDFNRNDLLAYSDGYGYQRGAGRRQAYERGDTIPLCVPLVDSDTFDYLQDITTSPVVDLYVGDDGNGQAQWKGVCVSAGTYTKATTELQDFIINLELPQIPVQRL